MGTWRALANPFSPCLLRKRQSWGACDSLFFPACRGKGRPRDSTGLRGWGAHGAPQGPEGLRGALQGFVAWNCLSFDRQGEMGITGTLGRFEHFEASGGAFSSTGRGKTVGAPQNKIPPLAPTFFEHVEAWGGVFSFTGRGKTAFAARIGLGRGAKLPKTWRIKARPDQRSADYGVKDFKDFVPLLSPKIPPPL